MTQIQLAPHLSKTAVPGSLSTRMWDDLGGHYMAIVELQVAQRTEPADELTEQSARLRIEGIEFARTPDDEDSLRRALRARYEARTAIGTLTEDIVDEAVLAIDATKWIEAMVDYVNAEGINGHKATARITAQGATIQVQRGDDS